MQPASIGSFITPIIINYLIFFYRTSQDNPDQQSAEDQISNYNSQNSESEFSITDSTSARLCGICHSRVNHRKYENHVKSCKHVLSKAGFINVISKKCEICDQIFESMQELFHHVKQDHSPAVRGVEKSTPEQQNGGAAARIEMTPSKRICQICNADYTSKNSRPSVYVKHIKRCKNLDNFTINGTTCKICQRKFPTGRGFLLGHIERTHLNEIKVANETDSKQTETTPDPTKVSQNLH